MNKIKITHLITGLNTGGAETMLYRLLCGYNRTRFVMDVISLTDIGSIGERIQDLKIPVYSLEIRKNLFLLSDLVRLIRILKKNQPDVLQTWMYHANFIGSLVIPFLKDTILIWNITRSYLQFGITKHSTFYIAKFCSYLSHFFPKKIICCAKSTVNFHVKFGYCKIKMLVIPNGFDLSIFKPDYLSYLSVRKELNLSKSDVIVGMIARFHPDKDYANFIKAAKMIVQDVENVNFVCCGKSVDWQNLELKDLIESVGLRERFHLIGERDDIPRLLAAFNLLISSSLTEGFSNAIGEAMACGTPCVVTDVGDSAEIVVDRDCLVPSADSQALADAVKRILSMDSKQREKLKKIGRNHIQNFYSLKCVIDQYQSVYEGMIK
jgi:glycosyltransferase involved in cell wall biosynthesis